MVRRAVVGPRHNSPLLNVVIPRYFVSENCDFSESCCSFSDRSMPSSVWTRKDLRVLSQAVDTEDDVVRHVGLELAKTPQRLVEAIGKGGMASRLIVRALLLPEAGSELPSSLDADSAQAVALLSCAAARKRLKDQNNPDAAKTVLEDIGRQAPRLVCQYVFKRNDIVWICRSCQSDETCVMCNACFLDSDHTGHDVFFYHAVAGGCCDCGDADAWDPKGFCRRHGCQDCRDPLQDAPRDLVQPTAIVIDEAVRAILLSCADSVGAYARWRDDHVDDDPPSSASRDSTTTTTSEKRVRRPVPIRPVLRRPMHLVLRPAREDVEAVDDDDGSKAARAASRELRRCAFRDGWPASCVDQDDDQDDDDEDMVYATEDDDDDQEQVAVVLHNDDVHATNDMISVLNLVGITESPSKARRVRDVGEVVLLWGAKLRMRQLATLLRSRGYLVSLRGSRAWYWGSRCRAAIEWLHGLARSSDALCRLVCEALDLDTLCGLLRGDSRIPKPTAKALHELYLTLMVRLCFCLFGFIYFFRLISSSNASSRRPTPTSTPTSPRTLLGVSVSANTHCIPSPFSSLTGRPLFRTSSKIMRSCRPSLRPSTGPSTSPRTRDLVPLRRTTRTTTRTPLPTTALLMMTTTPPKLLR